MSIAMPLMTPPPPITRAPSLKTGEEKRADCFILYAVESLNDPLRLPSYFCHSAQRGERRRRVAE